jgi:hypothetical protein
MGKSFGAFDWIDSRGVPLHQLYDERIRMVQAAEAGGFYPPRATRLFAADLQPDAPH